MKLNIKNRLGFGTLAVLTFAVASCSQEPVVQDYPDTTNPVTEIDHLTSDLAQAEFEQVNILSPDRYQNAEASLEEAKSSLDNKKDPSRTLHFVALGRAHLELANRSAETAHENIDDVIIARKSAIVAGAPGLFGKDFKNADNQLMKVTSRIEKNDLKEAALKRSELQNSYLDLELRSIKESRLAHVRATVSLALQEGAKKYAPRSLAIAQKSVLDCDAFITANRHASNDVTLRSNEAQAAADHLLKITRGAKADQRASSEDVALAYEKEQNAVGTKQNELASAQFKLNQRQNQLATKQGEVSALSAENKNLEVDHAFNQRFEAARAEFSSAEAEVYKQGNNLVIRLRGLEFPSAKAALRESNFPLLVKVQKVIRDFGKSSIIVEGHTDSSGGKQMNEKLSTERAGVVKEYLASNAGQNPGSDAIDIMSIGYGDQKPIASNKTAEGRAQNRRVDVIIQAKAPVTPL